jgi:hypothetical protein
VSDDTAAGLVAEMRAEAFDAARAQGGLCAICGRTLADDESVWLERLRNPRDPRAMLRAPVGDECASSETLERSEGQDAEPCDGCGRGVHYGARRSNRRTALCSIRCRTRVVVARQRTRKTGKAPA